MGDKKKKKDKKTRKKKLNWGMMLKKFTGKCQHVLPWQEMIRKVKCVVWGETF